jgi:hypothetical protein
MAYDLYNADTDPNLIYYNYATTLVQPAITTNITGATTIITTINGGGGGQASGPNVTFGGGTTGLNFIASGSTISLEGTLVVANGGTGAVTAAGARANLSAAASGANSDITTFTALTGSGGWAQWTGTPDKTAHATFSGTASVAYVQAEMQAVMDSLQEVTEGFMALLATLFAWGGAKT